LLTNNQLKIDELKEYGIEITERVPLQGELKEENKTYLTTKIEKMGQLLNY